MAAEALLGPFQKRASRTISNAALYDLVQDLATVVDTIPGRFDGIERTLKTIVEKLGAPNEIPYYRPGNSPP